MWTRIVIRWGRTTRLHTVMWVVLTLQCRPDGIAVPVWRHTYPITYIPIGYRVPDATLQGIICRNIGENRTYSWEKPYAFVRTIFYPPSLSLHSKQLSYNMLQTLKDEIKFIKLHWEIDFSPKNEKVCQNTITERRRSADNNYFLIKVCAGLRVLSR